MQLNDIASDTAACSSLNYLHSENYSITKCCPSKTTWYRFYILANLLCKYQQVKKNCIGWLLILCGEGYILLTD